MVSRVRREWRSDRYGAPLVPTQLAGNGKGEQAEGEQGEGGGLRNPCLRSDVDRERIAIGPAAQGPNIASGCQVEARKGFVVPNIRVGQRGTGDVTVRHGYKVLVAIQIDWVPE